MKTEAKFREGLISLMETRPLNEINVSLLCEFVNSNRQTFYYHYRDISDVVENIFLKERIGANKRLNDFSSISKSMVTYINANYRFLSEICKSYASDKLSEFIFSFYYKNIQQLFNQTAKNNLLHITISRYMSTIAAKEIVFWISTKRKEKTDDLLKRLDVLWIYLSTKYVSDLKKEKLGGYKTQS